MKTDNELIAEFMGLTPTEKEYLNLGTWYDMKFDTSWDWLMPVIKKISGLFEGGGDDYEELPDISHRVMCVTRHEIDTSIETIYREVIEFIKWQNQNKGK